MFKNQLKLSIVPVVYFITVILFRSKFEFLYEFTYDSTYAYLFNGLNLAQGKLILGHVDHPGTPVQIFAAIMLRIVHLFRNNHEIVDDVLINPELYLHYISNVIVVANSVMLFFLGRSLYRYSNNLYLPLFVQLTPFVAKKTIMFSPFLMVEPALIFVGGLLLIQFIHVIYKAKGDQNNSHLFVVSFLIALGVSCKINFLPVIIIPIVLFKGIFRKALSVFLTSVSLYIFLQPVLRQGDYFKNWTGRLITHTGKYGSGTKTFIDSDELIQNLMSLITEKYLIILVLVLLTAYCIRCLLKSRRLDVKARFLLATCLFGFMQLILVSKHYASHYLLPFELFLLLAIVVFYTRVDYKIEALFVRLNLKQEYFFYSTIIIMIAINWSALNLFSTREDYYGINYTGKNQLLVLSAGRSIPVKEAALYFGKSYSGKLKNSYTEKLYRLYPETMFYFKENGSFSNWAFELRLKDVLKASDTIMVRFNNNKDFNTHNWKNQLCPDEVWEDVIRNYGIVDSRNDSSFITVQTIPNTDSEFLEKDSLIFRLECNFNEFNESGQFITNLNSYKLTGVAANEIICPDTLMSSTLLMSPMHPYAISHKVPVLKNAYYMAKIIQKQSDYNGILVSTTKPASSFYKPGDVVVDSDSCYQTIFHRFTAESLKETDSVFIYLWYPHGEEAYFDNYELEIYIP